MIKEFPYNQIIHKALMLIWRNRWLWALGLFLFSSYDFNLFNFNTQNTSLSSQDFPLRGLRQSISEYVGQDPLIVTIALAVILAATLLLLYLEAIATGGIIDSTFKLTEKKIDVGLRSAIKNGRPYAWRLVGLKVASTAILVLFAVILIGPIYYLLRANLETRAYILAVIAFLIFAILFFIISLVVIFASNFVVLGNMRLNQAVSEGLNLFTKRWLVALFMALHVIILTLLTIVGFAILAAVGTVIIFTIANTMASESTSFIVFVIAAMVGALAALVLGAGVSAWQTAVWTLVWLELTRPQKFEESEAVSTEALAEPSSG